MKSELSSLELHYLLKELDYLESAKIEQIYQIRKEELIIQLHVPSTGKRILRMVLGRMMYLASAKGDVPEKPSGFCLHLRKRIKNARLRGISQLGFERIVAFLFETKEAKFRLIVELFSKGNVILCDEGLKILSVLERQEWKDRSIKPGELYSYPKKEFNMLELSREGLSSMLMRSGKESLVKALAIELGLGGVYAEELCLLAGVEKALKPNQLSDKEVDSVFSASQRLLEMEPAPQLVYSDDTKADVYDIVPFTLSSLEGRPSEMKESFNIALDSVLTAKSEEKALDATESAAQKKIGKVEEMIRQQRQRIEGLERSEKDNQRKGEVIYENYPLADQVLAEVNELKKTLSWKEIKEKFKGHKLIKDIDVKTGEVTLEL